jgi:hypothetical protein
MRNDGNQKMRKSRQEIRKQKREKRLKFNPQTQTQTLKFNPDDDVVESGYEVISEKRQAFRLVEMLVNFESEKACGRFFLKARLALSPTC